LKRESNGSPTAPVEPFRSGAEWWTALDDRVGVELRGRPGSGWWDDMEIVETGQSAAYDQLRG
jgi:hypothetical protein